MIQPGQIYRSLKPSDKGFRIRIVEVGATMARAVDAASGRPLLDSVMLHNLHNPPPHRIRPGGGAAADDVRLVLQPRHPPPVQPGKPLVHRHLDRLYG